MLVAGLFKNLNLLPHLCGISGGSTTCLNSICNYKSTEKRSTYAQLSKSSIEWALWTDLPSPLGQSYLSKWFFLVNAPVSSQLIGSIPQRHVEDSIVLTSDGPNPCCSKIHDETMSHYCMGVISMMLAYVQCICNPQKWELCRRQPKMMCKWMPHGDFKVLPSRKFNLG